MTNWTVDAAATALLEAEGAQAGREPLTDGWPGLDLATGYAVQDETLRRRLARGERLAGLKLGLTSVAKQQRMGISTPLTAWLTDAMVLPAGTAVPRDRLIHPRAEPENARDVRSVVFRSKFHLNYHIETQSGVP